jgi:type IV pilus assembly protein PilA
VLVNQKKENCMSKLRQRLAREEGFTLIELLIVIVIIGILLAIAVPSYLGFKDRANNRAAEADIRAAIPSMEAYFADNSTYVNADPAALKLIDSGLSSAIVTNGQSTTAYCIGADVNGKKWSVKGPGATQWYSGDTSCGTAGGSAATP